MSSQHFSLTVHLLLFLLVYADSANSQVHYYITPLLSVHCPGDPCLTLPQLAANSASYIGNETNISLFFLPGNHNLDGELSLSSAENFSITKVIGGNGTVFIECGSSSGRFNISETTFAMIKDLHFVGCGGNRVSQVKQFRVEDAIFEGVEGRGTALVLNQVTDASITRSSFLSNTHSSTFEHHDITSFDNLLNYLYLYRDPSLAVGGAVYTAFSNVSIVSSKFIDNRAKIGGALFAYSSCLHVVGSTYSYNKASFAGAMITLGSSINIKSSNFIENAAIIDGGVMIAYRDSFGIHDTTFADNSADGSAGVVLTYDSTFSIIDSIFSENIAKRSCGVIRAIYGSFTITGSTFTNNSAASHGVTSTSGSSFSAASRGGVISTSGSSFNITSSTFTNSTADRGGVMYTSGSSFNITSSTFTNSAASRGGVISTSGSSFNITSSTFTNNSAAVHGGVMNTFRSSLFNITSSTFTNNSAAYDGGVIASSTSSFNITRSTFTDNSAGIFGGGVMHTYHSSFNITSSTFANNSASGGGPGGVMYTSDSSFNITSSTFTNNSASGSGRGGVMYAVHSPLNIVCSSFYANSAISYGGIAIMFNILSSSIYITNGTFDYNSGCLYIFYSNLTFSGYTRLENSTVQPTETAGAREGGRAITSFLSTVIFTGESTLSNNQAKRGGGILAIESKIMMYGEITIANNTATVSSGGGISLQQSDLEVRADCIISGNDAVRGGGIHATSSTIAVYQPWTLQFINNRANNGSGLYLEVNAKLYVLKQKNIRYENSILFQANHANYGGAIYVADDTNAGACSPDHECFVQSLGLFQNFGFVIKFFHVVNVLKFSGNTASEQGANIFGGLLDRCISSPARAELPWILKSKTPHCGVSCFADITNNVALDTISSLPVRVCFCKSDSEPDCSYQPPTFKVKKGETFTVPLVAVDQVNHSVDANIISSLSSQDGGFSEGQQTQSVGKNCSNVTFNVFSPHKSETINLFADGPCLSSSLSTRHLYIHFSDCTCPIGFESSKTDTRCQCFCDARLSPHIINCDPVAESLVRVNTNSWITHINDTDPPGYIIHPNCPLDYCRPPTENVSMNLNLPDGADVQCAYNRSGVLCGGCQEHLSLSLGSSRCLSCHSHWPAVLVVILLAAIVAGILLVTALLALNMTVAIGLINGFIFYANIVAANSAIFFPSSEPSFPTVFVTWLNMDIGIDVCFFDGLDTYIKIWLQLAFPAYIISLVIIMIIVSEYSPRFAGLIGKRDPIATLATLILLSYAKLLSVTITALSFAVLDYPDGSRETVWLPDGNVPYFRGKHVALVLIALLIILVGVPYTILLFLWQWLVRAPEWKVFNWTRNTKLNAFISVHHSPYNSKYRYWTGLLLLVRVILCITASVTVSRDPQTSLLVTNILVGSLFLIKEITGARVYKKSFLNITETGLYFNLLALSAFSWYRFKIDIEKQIAVAYTSTIITFILLVGVIIYHVYLLVRKDHPRLGALEQLNEYLLVPVQPARNIVTHSSVKVPRVRDLSQPPAEMNNNQSNY